MKINLFSVFAVATGIMIASCGSSSLTGQKLKTQKDSLSYAFGIMNYNALINDSIILDPSFVAKAMTDGEKGTPLMSADEAQTILMMYLNERAMREEQRMAEANKVNFKEHIELNEKFLAENKTRSGVITTESGLQYEVVKMGNGEKPTLESMVSVHYTGTLIDGTEFDSSVKRNEPAQFPLGGVIQGWIEVLQLMPVGSKFKVYIPENLGYGANGAGAVIQPYSTLVFDVELLEILK